MHHLQTKPARSDGRRIPTDYHRTRGEELPVASFNSDPWDLDPGTVPPATQQTQRNADAPIAIAVGPADVSAAASVDLIRAPVPLVIPWPDMEKAEQMGARWDALRREHSAPWWAVWLNPGLHRWMDENDPMIPMLRRDAASVTGGCRVRLGADPGQPLGRKAKRKARQQGAEA